MSERSHIPGALRAVAIIHLAMGVGALAEVLVHLTRNSYQLNFGVLGIPVCFGLLRLSRGWRTCALALLWVGLVQMPLVFLMGIFGSGPATFGLLGIPVGQLPRPWPSVVAAAMFMLLLWQYRVLVSQGVSRLFFPEQAPAKKPQEPASAPSGAGS